jgi:hypothetical protein
LVVVIGSGSARLVGLVPGDRPRGSARGADRGAVGGPTHGVAPAANSRGNRTRL